MSRVYQIQVSEGVVHRVHVEDGIQTQLELVQILDSGRTGELLLEEAESRGFRREDGGAVKDAAEGIQVVIKPDGSVTVRAVHEETVELKGTAKGSYDDDFSTKAAAEAKLAEVIRGQLRGEAAQRDEAARKLLSDRLDKVLAEVKPELDAIANGVTRSALKERAGQLGEVTSVTENEAGEMTIRVRV